MPVDLRKVLFPLRYDVWDQAPAIAKLSDALNQYGIVKALEEGRSTAIYRHNVVADPAYQKLGLLNPLTGSELDERIERYYLDHLEKLLRYYQSIKRGWDKSQDKLYYKKVSGSTVTTAGNSVPEGLFLSNGQHRTTVLLALGYVELPGYMAGIKERSGEIFSPLDLTQVYIEAGLCTEQDFVKFARFRFPAIPGEIKDISSLTKWMKANGPTWAVEYIRIYWGG